MKKKYTLKVFPAGAGREVYRVIEISGDHSLDDLCGAILSAYDFIDEQYMLDISSIEKGGNL